MMRLVSFDIMAGIDGAAQRYNAQLEMASIAYERARKGGATVGEASKRATEELKAGLPSEETAEAIWRSLPGTFQELAIMRPGDKGQNIDKVVGAVTRFQTVADEWLGERVGNTVGWFRDKESGKHLPFPLTRILLPFVRTPLALANAAMRHSPAGLLHLRSAWKNLQNEKEIGGQVEWAAEEVWRRSYESILIGTIAMHGLAYALNAVGTNGDPDLEKTVEIMGKRIGYSRVEPFATPLAMAANGLKALKDGKPIWELPLHEVSALLKLGSDLAWFRLVADAGVAIKNIDKESRKKEGDVSGKMVEEVGMGATKTALSLVPVVGSRAIRGPLTSGDELTKASSEVAGYLKGEYGVDRVAKRDAWGRPLRRGPFESNDIGTNTGERFIQGGLGRTRLSQSNAVDTWLAEKGVEVPDWRATDEDGKTLRDQDADAFIEKAGPRLLVALERTMKSRPNITSENLKKAVTAHKRAIGRAVRRELALTD
jgi:hypothetical protein